MQTHTTTFEIALDRKTPRQSPSKSVIELNDSVRRASNRQRFGGADVIRFSNDIQVVAMPRQVREFRVVVASPADVADCRNAIFRALDEVSRVLEPQHISVRGLGWEEYVTLGIDVESQAVINKQLLKEYDIIIAVFGSQLGTPTQTSRSGTLHELEHAMNNSNSPMGMFRVHIYFKNT